MLAKIIAFILIVVWFFLLFKVIEDILGFNNLVIIVFTISFLYHVFGSQK